MRYGEVAEKSISYHFPSLSRFWWRLQDQDLAIDRLWYRMRDHATWFLPHSVPSRVDNIVFHLQTQGGSQNCNQRDTRYCLRILKSIENLVDLWRSRFSKLSCNNDEVVCSCVGVEEEVSWQADLDPNGQCKWLSGEWRVSVTRRKAKVLLWLTLSSRIPKKLKRLNAEMAVINQGSNIAILLTTELMHTPTTGLFMWSDTWFRFHCSTVSPPLLGLMESWQRRLGC